MGEQSSEQSIVLPDELFSGSFDRLFIDWVCIQNHLKKIFVKPVILFTFYIGFN